MLDRKFVRENPDRVRDAIRDKKESADVDAYLALEAERREVLARVESLRSERNAASEAIGRAKKSGEDASDAIAAMREVGGKIKADEQRLAALDD